MIAKEREFHPHFGEVPQSKGVPTALLVTVIVGIIVIFAIGGGVIVNSHYGHMWPSMTTLREPLKNPAQH